MSIEVVIKRRGDVYRTIKIESQGMNPNFPHCELFLADEKYDTELWQGDPPETMLLNVLGQICETEFDWS